MDSFIGISKAHTTNLAVVAPGIAEALLATALGLVAAIPAVMIYNVLAGTAPCSGHEKGDASQFPVLLDLGPDVDPRAAIGDKGHDSNASRLAANRIRSGGSAPARCALPRRQCCATTNFSSAAAWPPGQACQCREKQQRPGLSPTAVIRLRCLAKYEANARPQYEDRAGNVTSTSSSSSPSSWPWLTSFLSDDIEVG